MSHTIHNHNKNYPLEIVEKHPFVDCIQLAKAKTLPRVIYLEDVPIAQQQPGSMFLDQVAVWHFLQDLNAGSQEHLSGEGTVPLDEREATMCEQFCGLRLSSTIRWDLRRFCWSLVRIPTAS